VHILTPVSANAPTVRSVLPEAERERLVRRARLLAWASLAWMTAEGAVAIAAGIAASSIALIGFGIDSAIEGLASVVIIWRFWGKRALSEAAERRAQQLVAIQFFVLAPYVAIEAIRTLVTADAPDVSRLGIALTALSIVLMPYFGLAKRRVGARLGSAATRGEGMQNLLCAYLSVAVLVGLTLNALLGWWWADPLAALVIAGVAVREGLESWRGDDCC
jgi:divalent metal cation (Fe/Co/Zn/Cd) transporter